MSCVGCNESFPNKSMHQIHVFWCLNGHKCAVCPGSDHTYLMSKDLHDHCTLMHKRQGCRFCCGYYTPGKDHAEHFETHHPGIDFLEEVREWHQRQEEKRVEREKAWYEHEKQQDQEEYRRWKREQVWQEEKERKHERQKMARERKRQRNTEKMGRHRTESEQQHQQKKEDSKGHKQDRHKEERQKGEDWEHGKGSRKDRRRQKDWENPQPESGKKPEEIKQGKHDWSSNHYHTLGLHSWASSSAIETAAKKMRIACHPDRLKRQQGLTPAQLQEIDYIAKVVGGAADVLTDVTAKARYDFELVVCCKAGWRSG
ncbi:MAG: hypothetical protein LQ352_001507 [Teloschistes flavicans]|nr:MAG: hypothetical protein LQ352_001507 [Teloschistes flavicans]